MPQKKKQLRFKIPWVSKSKPERPPFRPPGKALAAAPSQPHSSPSAQSQQQQERESPSRPPHSPASSVILDSPVSSPSRPSTSLSPHEEDSSGQTTRSASKQEEKEIVLVMEHDEQPIKEESIESKMMFATSSSSTGKDIKVVSSSSGNTTTSTTMNISSINEEKQNHVNNQLQKGIKENISSFVQKLATVTPTQPPSMEVDDDHKSFSVVTLAGDNKGATMNVAEGSSNKTKKDGSIRIHRAYKKKNPEEEETTDAGDDENVNEGSSSKKKEDDDDVAGNKAYVNSNIQSVNNSLMMQGSVSERDPGVRIVLPYHHQHQKNTTPEAKEGRRVEMNGGNGVSYPRPVVRRRCLRGLFMEPSDSDPDNPDKPRRHGCKFRCGDKKPDEIM